MKKKVGRKLKQAAEAAGMRAIDVAAAVGVNQQTVDRWYEEKTDPDGPNLIALIKSVPGFGKLIGVEVAAA